MLCYVMRSSAQVLFSAVLSVLHPLPSIMQCSTGSRFKCCCSRTATVLCPCSYRSHKARSGSPFDSIRFESTALRSRARHVHVTRARAHTKFSCINAAHSTCTVLYCIVLNCAQSGAKRCNARASECGSRIPLPSPPFESRECANTHIAAYYAHISAVQSMLCSASEAEG